ncbi:MAG: DinB family protein [Reichenbachiella sp.]
MKKLIYLLVLSPILAFGQAPSLQEEVLGGTGYNESQITQLIQVIPTDKFAWSPGEGVRSVSEVVAHIAFANYMFSEKLGATIPEGVGYEDFEKTLKTKDDLASNITASFALLKETIGSVTDDQLAEKVEMPFGTFSKRALLMIVNSHCAEHKGQFIAYARMNDVTPPWSSKDN